MSNLEFFIYIFRLCFFINPWLCCSNRRTICHLGDLILYSSLWEHQIGKSRHKISNWQQYNQSLVQCGSLTLWMDKEAIKMWYCQRHHSQRGQSFHYTVAPTYERAFILVGLVNYSLLKQRASKDATSSRDLFFLTIRRLSFWLGQSYDSLHAQ